MDKRAFHHRIAFGVWLNDFRSEPITNEKWPSVIIDQQTMSDFQQTMRFIHRAGFTAIDLFGLLTNRDWPQDIETVISSDRKALVDRLIEIVHSHNLELIYGLGVYSWGFDTIIQNNPEVRGTNPSTMCGSREKARVLMEKVIDFVGENFAVDGYHLEAADQGRCRCEDCSKEDDITYYNRLNQQTATSIRTRWPEKILLVNTSGYLPWGDWIPAEDFHSVFDLGRTIDIFIDGGNHGQFIYEEDRQQFIAQLPCEYGTSGGFWIYPPQRWDRLRWFLPYFMKSAAHLRQLYLYGSRSCELYLGPLNNPGTEMTLFCLGRFLQDVDQNPLDLLEAAAEEIYQIHNPVQRHIFVELFHDAEMAFFNHSFPHRLTNLPEKYSDGIDTLFPWSKMHQERAIPGEFFLDSLLGEYPPFPVYLALHMNREGRLRYRKELGKLLKMVKSLLVIGGKSWYRVRSIERCIQNVIQDLDMIHAIPELNI